jgi:hypothetical protein
MNVHQHAFMTVHGRALLVSRIRWRVKDAAEAAGVSERSAYKWLARHGRAASGCFMTGVRRPPDAAIACRPGASPRSSGCGASG